MAGVAITTGSICVGSRCPHVLAGAGAVTTQNVTDPSIGPEVLAQLAAGATADTALAAVMADRPHSDYRQVALVDLAGNVAHFTGANILGPTLLPPVSAVLPQAICWPARLCRRDGHFLCRRCRSASC